MPDRKEPLVYNSVPQRRASIPAIISLSLGIVAIPLDCAYFAGAIAALAAIVSGIIAIVRIRKSDRYSGMAMATWGIILGILSLLLATACGIWLSGL